MIDRSISIFLSLALHHQITNLFNFEFSLANFEFTVLIQKIKNYTIVILIDIYLLFYSAIKMHSIKSLMQQLFHIFLLSLHHQTSRIL